MFVGRVAGYRGKVNNKDTCERGVKNKAWSIGNREGRRGSCSPPLHQEERPEWMERETYWHKGKWWKDFIPNSICFLMIRIGVHFSGLITRCQNRDFRENVEV